MTTTPTADRQSLAVFLSSQKSTAAEKILGAWDNDVNAAMTTKQIMDVTGLSRTTVNTNLSKLAQNGGVIRFDQEKVSTWSLTPTRKAAIKRATTKAAAEKAKAAKRVAAKARKTAVSTKKGNTVTDTNTEATADRTPTGRRVKGAIDFEIKAWFQENDNTPAGSYAVAKAIGSSSGAAYVALRRMANEGKAVLVSSEPDRYNIDFESTGWNTSSADDE